MSPQTYRTAKREDRNAHAATRGRVRAGTVLRHEMTVVASSVADVVAAAGGWMYDRRMAGWQVNVLLADRTGERALRILGADVLDLDDDLRAISDDPDRAATLAVAGDLYASDQRIKRLVSATDRRRAEVAMWGDPGFFDEDVSAVTYRLTAAARAFKAQALRAAGLPDDSVSSTEALFRCGVTALAPVAARS
jgi:hypothetical protein